MTIRHVAFIGLGSMGLPMATNLLKAGLIVHGFDLRKESEEVLAASGGKVGFATPAETARGVEAVISMLPSSPHVEAALGGADGVLSGLAPNAIAIDMSTIAPGVTRRMGELAAAKGIRMADAPVSGSTTGARDGTLTIMVGADPDLFAEIRPLLDLMGRNIIHVGRLGDGEAVKILNNLVAGVTMAVVAEAFTIAAKAGMDPKVLYDVMSKSSGSCWALSTRVPAPGVLTESPVNADFAPGFAADLMKKDLDLAGAFAHEVKSPLLLGRLASELYSSAGANGWGARDFSVVARVFERMAGQ